MKKKILVFHPALAPYRIDFFNQIDKACDATFYFTRQRMIEQRFDDNALRSQTHITSYFMKDTWHWGNKEFSKGYRQAFKKHQPDIIIGSELSMTTWRPLLHKLWRKATHWCTHKPIPEVWSIIDDSLPIATQWKGSALLQRRILIPLLDQFIVVNDQVADFFLTTYALKKRPIVMPIIQEDTRFHHKLELALPLTQHYIQQYKLQHTRILLFVGRLVPLKGVDRLIAAFCTSSPTPFDRLIIVGEGESLETLKAQVANTPYKEQILFVGRYEDIALYAWYLLGQTFTLCSDSEAFGAVVNEALLAGMPVLCTEVAGATSLITKTNGAIFPYKDINRLSKLIQQYLYQQAPLGDTITIRPSLMPFSFESCMKQVLKSLLS